MALMGSDQAKLEQDDQSRAVLDWLGSSGAQNLLKQVSADRAQTADKPDIQRGQEEVQRRRDDAVHNWLNTPEAQRFIMGRGDADIAMRQQGQRGPGTVGSPQQSQQRQPDMGFPGMGGAPQPDMGFPGMGGSYNPATMDPPAGRGYRPPRPDMGFPGMGAQSFPQQSMTQLPNRQPVGMPQQPDMGFPGQSMTQLPNRGFPGMESQGGGPMGPSLEERELQARLARRNRMLQSLAALQQGSGPDGGFAGMGQQGGFGYSYPGMY